MDVTAAVRLFAAVARRGSFSAGAAECGIPQPVASRRIAALEARWGDRLFDRTTRQVGLTEFGKAMLPVAARLVSAVDDLDAVAESARVATVSIAVPHEVAPAELARAVARAETAGLRIAPIGAGRAERDDLLRIGGVAAAVVTAVQAPDWSVPLGVGGADLTPTHPARLSPLRPHRSEAPAEWTRVHVQPEDDLDALGGELRKHAVNAGLSPAQIVVTRSAAVAAADALVSSALVLCSRAEATRWGLGWAPIHDLALARDHRLEARDRAVRDRVIAACAEEIGRALGVETEHR
ncbi:LysR family transcriptional regulator [Gryllotalpicola daejeonensis]|uniref:LysR family transcriptional regulator n=1 Tax=Gryllotalpicola daejeonensis TaxID=993087 RepID=A0ABP7ZM69_9MICO